MPSYLLFAFAPSMPFVIAGIVIGSLSGMTFPTMQSLMTAHVAEDAQGELQGAIASTVSVTSIIGPKVMTHIFGLFLEPGDSLLSRSTVHRFDEIAAHRNQSAMANAWSRATSEDS